MGKVMAPRLKTVKINKLVNLYIFKCKRAAKVENGEKYLVFFDELGPFMVVN